MMQEKIKLIEARLSRTNSLKDSASSSLMEAPTSASGTSSQILVSAKTPLAVEKKESVVKPGLPDVLCWPCSSFICLSIII